MTASRHASRRSAPVRAARLAGTPAYYLGRPADWWMNAMTARQRGDNSAGEDRHLGGHRRDT